MKRTGHRTKTIMAAIACVINRVEYTAHGHHIRLLGRFLQALRPKPQFVHVSEKLFPVGIVQITALKGRANLVRARGKGVGQPARLLELAGG